MAAINYSSSKSTSFFNKMIKEFYNNDINEIIQSIKKDSKKFKNKKILIVGSNGFLGKYFVEVFKNLSFIENSKIQVG